MRRLDLPTATLVAGLTAASTSAQATEVTDAGAAALLAGLTAWTATGLSSHPGQVGIRFDGSIAVEPAGERYVVSLPSGLLGGPNSGLRFGPIDMAVAPDDRGWFDITAQIPEHLEIVQPGRDTGSVATIGDHRLSGLFVPALAAFLEIDLLIGDFRLRPVGETGTLLIDRIGLVIDEENLGAGRSTLTYDMRVDALRLAGTAPPQLAFAELGLAGAVTGLRRDDAIAHAGGAGPPRLWLPWDLSALIAETRPLVAGLSASVRATDMSLTLDGLPRPLALGHVTVDMDLTGLDGETSGLHVVVRAESVDVPGVPFVGDLRPSMVVLDAEIEGARTGAVTDALVRWLDAIGQAWPIPATELAFMGISETVLLDEGVEVRLNALQIVSDTASIAATGHLVRDDPLGGFEMTVDMTGLSDIEAALAPWISGAELATLSAFLAAFGEPVTDGDGKPALRYEIVGNLEHGITVNGQDLRSRPDNPEP